MSIEHQFTVNRPTGKLLLKEAITAYKGDDKSQARLLLESASRESSDNELVLLWRAFFANNPAKEKEYIEEVLRINPKNDKALEWYANLQSVASALPTAQWECPLCRQECAAAPKQCPHCSGIIDLGDLDAFLTNEYARRDLIRAAIEHIRSAPNSGNDPESQVHLAMAHLNLLQSNEALIHLRKASVLRPENKVIKRLVWKLLARRQVMVVDDSLTIRIAVSGLLERSRYRSVAAVDGLDALVRLDEEIPDVVILDIKMPKLDGYQVCKALKANQRTRHVPVIMLSASLIDKVRGTMLGAVEFISKPFRNEALLKLIERHMPKPDVQPYTLLRS